MTGTRDARRKRLERIADQVDAERKLGPAPKNPKALERLARKGREPVSISIVEGNDLKLTADHALGLALTEWARLHSPRPGSLERAIAAEEALEALQAGRDPELSFETAVHLALNGHTAEAGAVYRLWLAHIRRRDREIRALQAKANRQLQHAKAARRNADQPTTNQLRTQVIESLERRLSARGKRLSFSAYAENIRCELKKPKEKLRTIRRIVTDYLAEK